MYKQLVAYYAGGCSGDVEQYIKKAAVPARDKCLVEFIQAPVPYGNDQAEDYRPTNFPTHGTSDFRHKNLHPQVGKQAV